MRSIIHCFVVRSDHVGERQILPDDATMKMPFVVYDRPSSAYTCNVRFEGFYVATDAKNVRKWGAGSGRELHS